jgi:penicillin-binding protein 1A
VAQQAKLVMQGVITHGTGTAAQLGGDEVVAGKTGTTENYGDAWFVGFDDKYTVAVWVGYPNEFKSMETEFNGEPVAGGTYPAGIFRTFIEGDLRNNPPKPEETPTPTTPAPGTTATPPPAATAPPTGGTEAEPAPTAAPTTTPAPTTAAPTSTPNPGGDTAPTG